MRGGGGGGGKGFYRITVEQIEENTCQRIVNEQGESNLRLVTFNAEDNTRSSHWQD